MTWKTPDDVVWHGDEEVAYAVHADGGPVHVLSTTAYLVWDAALGKHTPDEVVDEVSQALDQAPDLIRADVQTCLTELTAVGLLENTTPGAP
ncbi:coenzyme PQQ synthesis protein D (PqqD) [Barrientosiimonas humi]|uniref:Coenzyme PQQ synthesis protein D (PqqD) n=1 Tax=Barrientosiimonas humi TaxID=999931 RepID=A0A542XE18_9MICO|nr:PqqD family protein [Barrientosiimonas humi]TQL34077.1 coenzyme PQQ synthesis protein D (PqqD) [Barrientosiimonas humi]CAG7574067.1 hypothetical protein BH39T_PBIAJDOK_02710 [Barrientosiimonas humi]